MLRIIIILTLLIAGTAEAQMGFGRPSQGFLCEESPMDIYPDERWICEARQNFRKGFDAQALTLYKRAALWGSKVAQYKVGLMYLGGYGAEIDRIEGTAWLLLANERNRFRMTEQLDVAIREMDAAQVELAHARAKELRGEYGDLRALDRRARWVRKIKRQTTGSRTGNRAGSLRIAGTGITGVQKLDRVEAYEARLRSVIGTVEYRDFQVIEDEADASSDGP